MKWNTTPGMFWTRYEDSFWLWVLSTVQMAVSWKTRGVNLQCALFCRCHPSRGGWGWGGGGFSVTKGGSGRENQNKQVSLRLHRMFNYRHQKPRQPLDNKYSLYYHETKNKQPSTFQYADSKHLWLFHTRFLRIYGLSLHYWDNTTLRENKSTFHNHCFG